MPSLSRRCSRELASKPLHQAAFAEEEPFDTTS
jgi:hypothetical protein